MSLACSETFSQLLLRLDCKLGQGCEGHEPRCRRQEASRQCHWFFGRERNKTSYVRAGCVLRHDRSHRQERHIRRAQPQLRKSLSALGTAQSHERRLGIPNKLRVREWSVQSVESESFESFEGGQLEQANAPSGTAKSDSLQFAGLPVNSIKEVHEARIEKGEASGTFFAAISASTHRPPPLASPRQTASGWITLGVLASLFAASVWAVQRAEQRARELLGTPGEEPEIALPPPPPDMAERFERAKASVAQERLMERALSAIRLNDVTRCTVEVELALEENKLSRVSIEKDFYDPDELLQVYKAALKVWLDGYPPNYGQLLQLRSMLHISNDVAERIEDEIQRQADVFVI